MSKPKKTSDEEPEQHRSRLFLAVRKEEGELVTTSLGARAKAVQKLASLVGVKVEKAQRASVPRFIFETAPTILEPPHDQIGLYEIFMRGWVTRQILRAIRQEVLGAGVDEDPWTIEPKFLKKCTHCGKEFSVDVDKCDHCERVKVDYKLRDPDEVERHTAEQLTSKPNPEYNFFSLLSSTISYYLSLDDFYWSIVYGYELNEKKIPVELVRKPRELYVEDSRFIRPVADSYGHLGNDEYFCPTCYDPKHDQPRVKLDLNEVLQNKIPKCPQCGGELTQTCWVQHIGGQVKARLGRDEIVHGSGERVLPDLYGNPKMLSLVKLVETLAAMDEYNLGVYSEGKVGSLVVFPGMEQDAINSMLSKAQHALEEREKEDLQSGKLIAKKKVRTIFLGVKESPTRIPVMEDFEKMQSLEFYKLAVEKVCSTYGVTPVFVSIIESGKSGNNPRMQIDVQDHTTREVRRLLESVVNEQLFTLFNIHDWAWRFGAIQQRDDLRVAQIEQVRSLTAINWKNAGFTVTLNEDGELEVSGTPSPSTEKPSPEGVPGAPSPPSSSIPSQGLPSLPQESEASGDLIQREDVARLPISWYDMSKISYEGHEYFLNNDKDTVTLNIDHARQEGVWTTRQLGDALAALLQSLFNNVRDSLTSSPGFNRISYESYSNSVASAYRRNLDEGKNVLTGFCSELDNIGLKPLASLLDEWRERVATLRQSSLEEVS